MWKCLAHNNVLCYQICGVSALLQYSILKIGWPHGFGHTVIALHTVIRYTRLFGWIWGRNDIWKSSDRTWACSRLFFFLENCNLGFWKPILGFWKPSESIGACSRLFFFLKNGNLGFWKVSTRLLRTHTVIRYTVIALHTVIAYPHGY